MIKRRRFFLGAVAGCAALVMSVFTLPAVAEDKVRLRFQTFYGTEMDPVTKQFVKNVKEWSNGSLRILMFRGGELISNDQLLGAVSKGTVDMVHGYGAYWSGTVDMGNLEAGLPGAWSSVDEAKDIFFNQGFSDLLGEAFSEHGVHYITSGFGGRNDLLTREPIDSLDDLKKIKVRATTQAGAVLKKLDIPSVYLPAQELYVGLSTGVIDGVIYGGPYDYHSLKLHESAKYYTTLNMLSPGWTEAYLVNQEKWGELSEAHREVLTRASKQMAEDMLKYLHDGDAKVLSMNVFQMSELSTSDSARITAAAQEVWDDEAARSERNAKAVEILRANAKAKGRL